jgi:triacylglycerol lipase
MAWMSGAVTWRLVQLGSVVLALAWAVWWRRLGGGVVGAGCGVAAVLLSPVWLLGLQSARAACLNQEDRLPLRVHWRAWAAEVGWNLRVFGWQQPWRAGACPDTAVPIPRRGVLLVHGHLCTRAFWLPWLRRLQAEGVPFAAVELWPPWRDIDSHAPAIDAALRRLTALTGEAPVVLAHSKGGLNVRAWRRWALAHGDPAPERRVHALITVATPHRGTLLAMSVLAGPARQMRPGSAWLAALAASEPAAWRRRIGCIASAADAVVYPSSLALLDGAGQRVVPDCAHIELAFSDAVGQWVRQALTGPAEQWPW